MGDADNDSLYAEIRVLSELLKSFRSYTEEKLKHINELQERVTVINTRCGEKTCVYDKVVEKYGDLKESLSRMDSGIVYIGDKYKEVKEQVNRLKDVEYKRLNDTIVRAEGTLEKTRDKTSSAIWNVIPIVVSIVSVIASVTVSLFLR